MSHPIPWLDYDDCAEIRWWQEVGALEQLRREYEDWLEDTGEQIEYQQWLDQRRL